MIPPLVQLLRQLPGDASAAAATLSPAQWAQLPSDAERHGFSGLLIDALPPGLAPKTVEAALRGQARSGAAHAMKLHQLLLDVLKELGQRGVAPVLMKGWGLGLRYWPDPLLRPSSDVDVLVETAALPVVEEALRALGLQRVVDPGFDDVYEDHHHLSFSSSRGLVELHFRLLAGFGGASLGDAAVFSRCRPASLEGFAVRYLAPEDELVYLASHATQHLFLRLAWLYDLKLLAAKETLDWERLVREAKAASLRAATHAALLLARELLDAPIPDSALQALAPTRLHAEAVRRTFTGEVLVAARLAQSKSASALRATLSDNPVRAARHLAEGAMRNVRRRVRGGQIG